jgi:hypothetical protein
MSSLIQPILELKLKRKTLKKLSFNTVSENHFVNSDKKCYDFDKIHPNNSTVDALEYNGAAYYLIEFKDERAYNPIHHWKKITEIVSKSFQSMNSILGLYTSNNLPKIDFYTNKIHFLVVFSSTKSTDLNDFKTLKTYLKEKYGNIFEIDILNERMFIEDYVNTNKVGI